MDLSYQYHTHMKDGRNYVMLNKFLIHVSKSYKEQNTSSSTRSNQLQDTSSYERAKKSQRYI